MKLTNPVREIRQVFYCLLFTLDWAKGLEISPDVTVSWLLEGEPLILSCQFTGRYTSVNWKKEDVNLLDDGFNILIARHTNNNGDHLYDVTARKEMTSHSEEGTYTCETDYEQKAIVVHVFKIEVKHGSYSTTLPMFTLCRPVFSTPSPQSCFVEWSREGSDLTTLPDSSFKYAVHEGGTILEIKDADLGDMGEYKCTVTLNRGTADPQRFVKMISVFSEPLLQNHSKISLTTVSIGQSFELSCEAHGHPQPEVTWFRDSFSNGAIMEGDRTIVTSRGKLVILNTRTDDKGTYYCICENRLGYLKRIFNVDVL